MKEERYRSRGMITLFSRETPWTQGCCSNICPNSELASSKHSPSPRTTTMVNRTNFARSTRSTIFPDTQFTNHESLPSLTDAFAAFSDAYLQYGDTEQADRIRGREYSHLADHVCLDYTGLSLFSHAQLHSSVEASSSWQLRPPFFSISYNSTSLASHVRYGCQESGIESAMRSRIMSFLNVSEEEYTMVCTANKTSAFRLLAETFPFQSSKRLLTVYDHESEAVSAMVESADKRGAKVMSASFSWPSLRIDSAKLKRILSKRKKKRRGLLVFPLQSSMTGTRHPYFWMKLAQENGWHVLLDASALGPKDTDTLGLSLIQPDFMICSFFKLVGDDPSGFASLFVKKSSSAVLETSATATSIGIVTIVPSKKADDISGTQSDSETMSSLSGPVPTPRCDKPAQIDDALDDLRCKQSNRSDPDDANELVCEGFDHADSLGLILISCRLRCLTNWLVTALTKLQHPNSTDGRSLVRIYGPRVKFDRGPALAFNVFDWKGEKVEPALVQKLADRSNISLGCGFLRNICFPERYEEVRDAASVSAPRNCGASYRRKESNGCAGIGVVNATLGFLSNFEDAYRLWAFVAKFLDADFVEKERWRYMALNQKLVEV